MMHQSSSQEDSFFQNGRSSTVASVPKDKDEFPGLGSMTLVGNGGSPTPSKKRMQLELLDEIMKEKPDMNKLRMLQTFDVDYSVKDPQSGVSILHHAAFHGEIDLLQLGLEAGLLVDESTKLGRTPLHFACAGNQRSAVCFLLKHGANVNAQTCAGMVRCMASHYLFTTVTTSSSNPPSGLPLPQRDTTLPTRNITKVGKQCATELPEDKLPLIAYGVRGDVSPLLTPLHLAVRENAVAAIKSLLFSKESEGKVAEIELEDMERKTPLSMATNKQVKEMLLRYKRSFNKANQAELSPLAGDGAVAEE